jgi:hypothetical protein
MSTYIFITVAAFLLLLVILALFSRSRGGSVRTVERIGESRNPIRDTPGGALLRAYMLVIYNQGEEADALYQSRLKKLQDDPVGVIEEIVNAYSATPAQDYGLRWALVYCASRLAHEASLPFLIDVAQARVPPEESKDVHLFSTVAEETSIRLRAIDGIENLAASGNAEARESLFAFLRLPLFSLRVAASQALLGLPDGKNYRGRVVEILGEDDFILDIKRVTTMETATVGQSSGRHSATRQTTIKPPLPGEGPAPQVAYRSQRKGPPVAGGER